MSVQVACAADSPPRESVLWAASCIIYNRNLLTMALDLRDPVLVSAVLCSLDKLSSQDPTRFPGGLPYIDVQHLQVGGWVLRGREGCRASSCREGPMAFSFLLLLMPLPPAHDSHPFLPSL